MVVVLRDGDDSLKSFFPGSVGWPEGVNFVKIRKVNLSVDSGSQSIFIAVQVWRLEERSPIHKDDVMS
jgi:hypothetical protein